MSKSIEFEPLLGSTPLSHRLIKGSVQNFSGQVLPMAVGVVTLPGIIHGFGPERFGIFALALAVLGTFSLFDFGMPRATTKFLAESLASGDTSSFVKTFWTSLVIQLVLGSIACGLLLSVIPQVGNGILKVDAGLVGEARRSFWFIALSLPFVMLTSGARGALEAGQKFGVTNALRIPLSSMMYVIPAVALPFNIRLPGVLLLILMARILITGLHLLFCFKTYPTLRRFEISVQLLRPMLSFGGWVLVAGVVVALMASVDRILIGAIQTTAAVGYYSVPIDVLSRLLIIPMSLVMTLFPALSMAGQQSDRAGTARIFSQSIKFLVLIMGPISLFLVVSAPLILRLWLGAEFASQSTLVFQIVAVAVFLDSLSFVPFTLLQAWGRPDVPAKGLLLSFPVYLGLLWLLTTYFGIPGAALAWVAKVIANLAWCFIALRRVRGAKVDLVGTAGIFKAIVSIGLLTSICLLANHWLVGQWLAQALACAMILVFAFFSWRRLLETSEKKVIVAIASRPFQRMFIGTR